LINNSVKKEKDQHSYNYSPSNSKNVNEEELDKLEELSVKIDVLVELLSEKGIINKKIYINNLMMHLHQTSKAKSFERFDQEI
jgi:hypothetical protein